MSVDVFQELKIRAQLDPVVRRNLAAHPLQFLANFDLSFDEVRQLILPQDLRLCRFLRQKMHM